MTDGKERPLQVGLQSARSLMTHNAEHTEKKRKKKKGNSSRSPSSSQGSAACFLSISLPVFPPLLACQS